MRHKQGFDAYEILKEYEFLGGILFEFFTRTVEEISQPCQKSELMACGSRLYRAVTIIQQSTMTHFLLLADKHVAEREERLRAFNRVISHEIKNRVGVILGAASVLNELSEISPDRRAELEDKMSPTIWLLTQAELPELYEDARTIAELRLRELGADEAVDRGRLGDRELLDQVADRALGDQQQIEDPPPVGFGEHREWRHHHRAAYPISYINVHS